MADTKITALAAITTVDPAADVLPIVDVSDTSMAASGTTKKITSNQILGAGGTATLASATITGAASVGTTLGVTGVSTFAAGTALLPALTTTGDTNTGVYYPAADTFAVTTGGSERLRIDSLGNLGIGVSPSYRLDINGTLRISNFGIIRFDTGTNTGFVDYNDTRLQLHAGPLPMYFVTGSTLKMTLDASGNLGIGVTPAGTGGCLQLKSGITFPATQVASTDPNTLDDYEEGTWTGTLKGLTTDPTTPVTATGRYTKIGRQVSVDINFSGVNTTGASGQIKVAGAPFTSNGTVPSTGPVMMSSIGTFTGVPAAFIGTGTTEIELYAFSSAGAQTFVTHNAGTARSLWVSLTYTV